MGETVISGVSNISLMNDTGARLSLDQKGATLLPLMMKTGLGLNIVQPIAGYTPPGDDDFSFAGSDDNQLANSIRQGFADSFASGKVSSVVLTTLAERGAHTIAAAYLVTDTGKNGLEISRIGRQRVKTEDLKSPDDFKKMYDGLIAEVRQSIPGQNSYQPYTPPAADAAPPPGTTGPSNQFFDDPDTTGGMLKVVPHEDGDIYQILPRDSVGAARAKPSAP